MHHNLHTWAAENAAKLLESCNNIQSDSRSQLRFIVVENGLIGTTRNIISDFGPGLNIDYVHEENIGIVHARNVGVAAFLKTDAEWMATIDDDETIAKDWLIEMLNAIETYPDCKTFAGPHHRINPEGSSQWLTSKPLENPETGSHHWNCSTANAVFHRDVFSKNGLGLRFNPLFNLSGGSDTFLFFQLKDLGQTVIWVREAECFEPTIEVRTHFKFRVKRTIQISQNWAKTTIIRFGKFNGGRSVILDGLNYFVNFFTFGAVGGLVYVFNRKIGRNILNRSLVFGCLTIGYFKALTRPQGERYKNVDGE